MQPLTRLHPPAPRPPAPTHPCSATLGGGLFIISVIFVVVALVRKAGAADAAGTAGEPHEITVNGQDPCLVDSLGGSQTAAGLGAARLQKLSGCFNRTC